MSDEYIILGFKKGDLVVSRISGSVGCGIVIDIGGWADGWMTISWTPGGNENWAMGMSAEKNLKVIGRL